MRLPLSAIFGGNRMDQRFQIVQHRGFLKQQNQSMMHIIFREIISAPWKLLEIDRVLGMETISIFCIIVSCPKERARIIIIFSLDTQL